MKKIILIFIVFSCSNYIFSQTEYKAVFPDSLKKNANAIIQEDFTDIEIESIDKMTIKKRRVITVLNEQGLRNVDAVEYFSKSNNIKKIEVTIFNLFGKEIKKIKKKDFVESAVGDGFISDNRVLYLNYTPIQYPFTILFESERVTSNTSYIPSWQATDDYFVHTLKSSVHLKYSENIKFKYKEVNFTNQVKKEFKQNELYYEIENYKPFKKEELAPSLKKMVPYVLFGLDEFSYEGIKGYATNWQVFGDWVNQEMLKNTDVIEPETILKLKNLIGEEKDNLKIAEIIYKYVQDKTRYVSIQLGVGGWKPMLARDVDRLGYGDCKALTNYTRSLLKAFNIDSYYTIVYSGSNKMDLQEDFVSMQGDHAILGIPNNNTNVWLECTSQTQPFGFQGDFTDDRKVLIISPEASKIVKTSSYNNEKNSQKTETIINFLEEGKINCNVSILSKGIIYDSKLNLELKSKAELNKFYNSYLDKINNKNFDQIEVVNNRKSLEFTENLKFSATEFVQKSGNRYIIPINVINPISYIPYNYEERNNPFEIDRGYFLDDEVVFNYPANSSLESIPKNITIESEFGKYEVQINRKENNSLVLRRKLLLKKGFYTSEKYNSYRKFRETIAKTENLKIVILTN
ncbi:DUF3857 domain-containing protein [Flavobacterium sp. N2270]|uniref:DUF3857 domain-containing protein n=1 Tax=Flavobacterium sp. N2270 TaxID=2986831 RepID=UPI0022247EF7|nr:DUF3857 domain-containing protein [Flavobacterium sp. N2270]